MNNEEGIILRMSNEESLNLLEELSNAYGVPGHEDDVRSIFVKRLSSLGFLECDRNGSVFCSFGQGASVMIAGHMDEVGFMVQGITNEGFLQFVALGGWWTHTLLSQRVVIKSSTGK